MILNAILLIAGLVLLGGWRYTHELLVEARSISANYRAGYERIAKRLWEDEAEFRAKLCEIQADDTRVVQELMRQVKAEADRIAGARR